MSKNARRNRRRSRQPKPEKCGSERRAERRARTSLDTAYWRFHDFREMFTNVDDLRAHVMKELERLANIQFPELKSYTDYYSDYVRWKTR